MVRLSCSEKFVSSFFYLLQCCFCPDGLDGQPFSMGFNGLQVNYWPSVVEHTGEVQTPDTVVMGNEGLAGYERVQCDLPNPGSESSLQLISTDTCKYVKFHISNACTSN